MCFRRQKRCVGFGPLFFHLFLVGRVVARVNLWRYPQAVADSSHVEQKSNGHREVANDFGVQLSTEVQQRGTCQGDDKKRAGAGGTIHNSIFQIV